MKQNISFRLRISLLVFGLVLAAFLFFFAIENFIWLGKISDTNPDIFPRNFFIGRFLIATSFSILAGLGSYVFTNNFYESLRHLAHLIQYWSKTLTPLDENAITLFQDSEVTQIISFFHKGIIANKQREEDRLIKSIELNNTNIVERLKPYLPELELGGLKNLDISVFPNYTNNPRCDFVNVIEMESGYLCVVAGFENLEILESIYKYKLQGIFALIKSLYHAKEEEVLLQVTNAIAQTKKENLNLSLLYVSNTSNHVSFTHNQKMPLLLLDDQGLSTTFSEDIHFDFTSKEPMLLKAVFASPSYLILFSDRIHEVLDVNPSQLVSELETEVFSKPKFKNSKELILQISLFIDGYGKSKGLKNALEHLACIVVKKTG
jgi:Arg-Lys translocation region protein phosphatase